MNQLRTFLYGIGITFGLPWLLLVVIPWFQLRAVEPIPYEADTDELKGLFPPAVAHENGRLIYAREGCAHCHTQVVRAPYVGMDAWKLGWGRDQSPRPAGPTRQTSVLDYHGEPFAMLGYRRIGPDLANVGWRTTNPQDGAEANDRRWHHRHLYDPRSIHDWSTMPSFRHLYRKIPIEGQKLESAVDTVTSADGRAYQIVPTADAEALVEYLMSLKKAWPMPGEGSDDDDNNDNGEG